jgi:hypothetical protein
MSKSIPFKRAMKSSVEKHGGQAVADTINTNHNLGHLTDEQFVKYMDELYGYIPKEWKKNIDHRRDGRSPGQLFLDLKKGIKIENLLFRAFVQDVWLPAFSLGEEYGRVKANKGRPWLDPAIVEKTEDYTLRLPDREIPVDVKFVKNPAICTPKEEDLKFCVRKGIYMLVFWNGGAVDGTKRTFDRNITKFALLSPSNMAKMLDEVPATQPSFYYGKRARQVFRDKAPNFTEYFDQHPWSPKSFPIPQ